MGSAILESSAECIVREIIMPTNEVYQFILEKIISVVAGYQDIPAEMPNEQPNHIPQFLAFICRQAFYPDTYAALKSIGETDFGIDTPLTRFKQYLTLADGLSDEDSVEFFNDPSHSQKYFEVYAAAIDDFDNNEAERIIPAIVSALLSHTSLRKYFEQEATKSQLSITTYLRYYVYDMLLEAHQIIIEACFSARVSSEKYSSPISVLHGYATKVVLDITKSISFSALSAAAAPAAKISSSPQVEQRLEAQYTSSRAGFLEKKQQNPDLIDSLDRPLTSFAQYEIYQSYADVKAQQNMTSTNNNEKLLEFLAAVQALAEDPNADITVIKECNRLFTLVNFDEQADVAKVIELAKVLCLQPLEIKTTCYRNIPSILFTEIIDISRDIIEPAKLEYEHIKNEKIAAIRRECEQLNSPTITAECERLIKLIIFTPETDASKIVGFASRTYLLDEPIKAQCLHWVQPFLDETNLSKSMWLAFQSDAVVKGSDFYTFVKNRLIDGIRNPAYSTLGEFSGAAPRLLDLDRARREGLIDPSMSSFAKKTLEYDFFYNLQTFDRNGAVLAFKAFINEHKDKLSTQDSDPYNAELTASFFTLYNNALESFDSHAVERIIPQIITAILANPRFVEEASVQARNKNISLTLHLEETISTLAHQAYAMAIDAHCYPPKQLDSTQKNVWLKGMVALNNDFTHMVSLERQKGEEFAEMEEQTRDEHALDYFNQIPLTDQQFQALYAQFKKARATFCTAITSAPIAVYKEIRPAFSSTIEAALEYKALGTVAIWLDERQPHIGKMGEFFSLVAKISYDTPLMAACNRLAVDIHFTESTASQKIIDFAKIIAEEKDDRLQKIYYELARHTEFNKTRKIEQLKQKAQDIFARLSSPVAKEVFPHLMAHMHFSDADLDARITLVINFVNMVADYRDAQLNGVILQLAARLSFDTKTEFQDTLISCAQKVVDLSQEELAEYDQLVAIKVVLPQGNTVDQLEGFVTKKVNLAKLLSHLTDPQIKEKYYILAKNMIAAGGTLDQVQAIAAHFETIDKLSTEQRNVFCSLCARITIKNDDEQTDLSYLTQVIEGLIPLIERVAAFPTARENGLRAAYLKLGESPKKISSLADTQHLNEIAAYFESLQQDASPQVLSLYCQFIHKVTNKNPNLNSVMTFARYAFKSAVKIDRESPAIHDMCFKLLRETDYSDIFRTYTVDDDLETIIKLDEKITVARNGKETPFLDQQAYLYIGKCTELPPSPFAELSTVIAGNTRTEPAIKDKAKLFHALSTKEIQDSLTIRDFDDAVIQAEYPLAFKTKWFSRTSKAKAAVHAYRDAFIKKYPLQHHLWEERMRLSEGSTQRNNIDLILTAISTSKLTVATNEHNARYFQTEDQTLNEVLMKITSHQNAWLNEGTLPATLSVRTVDLLNSALKTPEKLSSKLPPASSDPIRGELTAELFEKIKEKLAKLEKTLAFRGTVKNKKMGALKRILAEHDKGTLVLEHVNEYLRDPHVTAGLFNSEVTDLLVEVAQYLTLRYPQVSALCAMLEKSKPTPQGELGKQFVAATLEQYEFALENSQALALETPGAHLLTKEYLLLLEKDMTGSPKILLETSELTEILAQLKLTDGILVSDQKQAGKYPLEVKSANGKHYMYVFIDKHKKYAQKVEVKQVSSEDDSAATQWNVVDKPRVQWAKPKFTTDDAALHGTQSLSKEEQDYIVQTYKKLPMGKKLSKDDAAVTPYLEHSVIITKKKGMTSWLYPYDVYAFCPRTEEAASKTAEHWTLRKGFFGRDPKLVKKETNSVEINSTAGKKTYSFQGR